MSTPSSTNATSDPAPLSFPQERHWLIHQLDPDQAASLPSPPLRLFGPLDEDALEQSINQVFARHDILRTRFVRVGNEPRQLVQPQAQVEVRLEREDLTDLPLADRLAEAYHRIRTPKLVADLEFGRLSQFRLLRLDDEDHILIATIHHILWDGPSVDVFFTELSAIYPAVLARQPCPLPEVAGQYAEFALWQRRQAESAAFDADTAFWTERLQDFPGLDLPYDMTENRRAPGLGKRCEPVDTFISQHLLEKLETVKTAEGTSLFTLILTALGVLLQRYSGQSDIPIGVAYGRRNPEFDGFIGDFNNTLILRADLAGDPTFRQLLARVKAVAKEAYTHAAVPFEMVTHAANLHLGSKNLLPAFVNWVDTRRIPATMGPLRTDRMWLPALGAPFDLHPCFTRRTDGIAAYWVYDSRCFRKETVERIGRHFTNLLEAVVANPGQKISRLRLLDEDERTRLIRAGAVSVPGATFPPECLHQAFEAQADRTPDNIAVTCEGTSFTYAELNGKANRLAHVLRARGVEPDTLVGLCIERSTDLLVGILGILKAGGGYVPLDPTTPQERMAFILDDTDVSVLVTTSDLADSLPDHPTGRICLDTDCELLDLESDGNPSSGATPDNIAYVIYTSGSTGQPKGVVVEHRNVTRLFTATEAWFEFNQTDVWTLFHSCAFDFSVWEIWGALLYGGRLVVVPYWISRSPAEFHELLAHERVTVLNQTPSAFRQLMEADQQAVDPEDREVGQLALRFVIFGGEALDPASLKPWSDRHGDAQPQLVNMYGITETTVHVTHRPLRARDIENPQGSVIGQPIPDLELYILDEHLEPVPVGVRGELYVGGAGVARGYLNRPDLTRERFLNNPFRTDQDARLYRTGDLARHLPDGDVEYLGRNDFQVKIRGFRIELGEIEAALCLHPRVREAVVLARPEERGEGDESMRLVAYLTTASEEPPTVSALRSFLKQRLLDYMVPGAFVLLDEMPMSSSNKIDRKRLALIEPQIESPASTTSSRAPRGPMEEAVAEAFRDVLHVDRIAVDDDFFELGGHSLLATQIVSRIRDTLDVEVPLPDVFAHPTIRELSIHVESLGANPVAACAPPLKRLDRAGELPLSFAQQRLRFLDKLHPGKGAFNISDAVRMRGALDIDALTRSLTEILRRHESLRTTFTDVGDDSVQVIHPPKPVELPLIDLGAHSSTERQTEILRLAQEETHYPFDLERGPLLRTILARLDDTEHVFLVTMHHIVSDAWSMAVFVRELGALYDAFAAGRESPLSELTIQYADFAGWQRKWLSGDTLKSQFDYWREQLAEKPAPLELLTDRSRPRLEEFDGALRTVTFPAELLASLNVLSKTEGVTLFTTLLAAFKALLHRYTNQTEIVLGSPIAGRNRAETEQLIGFFVNSLVMRTELSGDLSFRELIRRVWKVNLGALAHQDVPFEQLVEVLDPERDTSRHPLFQVMFQLDNAPQQALRLGDLSFESVAPEHRAAQFEMSVFCREVAKGLEVLVSYRTRLFDASTIDRMLTHFRCTLEAVVADPDMALSGFSLLAEGERRQLIDERSGDRTEYPREASIHALFQEQALATPDAPALESYGRSMTYRELDARSNQLAHHLASLGVRRETMVGISMDRSPDMLVGILGILKAGGAYVPLDPTYPKSRLAFMIEDTRAPILLTQKHLVESLPDVAAQGISVIELDGDWPAIAQHPETAPGVEVSATDLAYVIYTSGSTGRPKGVLVEHRNVVRLVKNTNYVELGPDQTFLQFAPISFDASTFELWGSLLNGAKLVIFPPGIPSLEQLGQFIEDHGITTLWLTAALFRQMVDVQLDLLLGVKQLLAGGETLSLPHVRKFLDAMDGSGRLVNGYGPTENTTFTCCHVMARESELGASVPIGKPIANTRVYILDEQLEPVPVGVPGRLYAGGDGVARGYLNDAALTAAKFRDDPFAPASGGRLYDTGDQARWLADGTIEFLGRKDHQVKVRGFRIELGEIEEALIGHSQVGESVVTIQEGADQESNRLVAYLVVSDSKLPASSELRTFLQERLPNYMIPAMFIALDALPLNKNGKIDRQALPAPGEVQLATESVAPRNPTEESIAVIWSELLGIGRVGVTDGFFELGGNSLLGMRMINRLRIALGVEVSLQMMFDKPTVEALAEHVDSLVWLRDGNSAVGASDDLEEFDL